MINIAQRPDLAGPVMRFLLSPEDSSGPRPILPSPASARMQATKSVLWIVCAVMMSLLIGQL